MQRRHFIASLFAAPVAVKAAPVVAKAIAHPAIDWRKFEPRVVIGCDASQLLAAANEVGEAIRQNMRMASTTSMLERIERSTREVAAMEWK